MQIIAPPRNVRITLKDAAGNQIEDCLMSAEEAAHLAYDFLRTQADDHELQIEGRAGGSIEFAVVEETP